MNSLLVDIDFTSNRSFNPDQSVVSLFGGYLVLEYDTLSSEPHNLSSTHSWKQELLLHRQAVLKVVVW